MPSGIGQQAISRAACDFDGLNIAGSAVTDLFLRFSELAPAPRRMLDWCDKLSISPDGPVKGHAREEHGPLLPTFRALFVVEFVPRKVF